jgi:hypothetical protein
MFGFSPWGTATPGEVRGAVTGNGSVTIGMSDAYGAAYVIAPTTSTPVAVMDLGSRSVGVSIDSATIPYYPDPRSPSDVSLYGIQICDLPAAETVTSVVSVTASPSDLVVGTPQLYGLVIQYLISGGTSGVEYTLTTVFRSSSGETYSRSAILYTVQR